VGKNFTVLDIFLWNIYRDTPSTIFFQISKLIFDTLIWKNIVEGVLYKYPMKNISRMAKFLPTFGKVKDIARVFNWLKCLGGIMHLKPTAGCQISILILENPLHNFFSNIKVDIWHPAVGLRCIIPPSHLSQLKTRAISLTLPKVGKNFAILDIFYIKDGKVFAHFWLD
jgi:hypothetical protein